MMIAIIVLFKLSRNHPVACKSVGRRQACVHIGKRLLLVGRPPDRLVVFDLHRKT